MGWRRQPGTKSQPSIYSNLNNFSDTQRDHWFQSVGRPSRIRGSRQVGFIDQWPPPAWRTWLTTSSAGQSLTLWDVDANWHWGNWDARFELARTEQSTPNHAPPDRAIRLLYAGGLPPVRQPQLVLAEASSGYSVSITCNSMGINSGSRPGSTSAASTWLTMPAARADRNRFTIGANYWFYPSLVLKLAIEFNEELGVPSLRDNGFIGQLVRGF